MTTMSFGTLALIGLCGLAEPLLGGGAWAAAAEAARASDRVSAHGSVRANAHAKDILS
jgi:hypothetical protein